ncbi:MAG: hypothetical protein RIG84_12340 [Roseovarius sp.]
MSARPPLIFVERRTYRRRRLADAARLMPAFGALLFLIPLLWKGDGTPGQGASTSMVMLYLFLVWFGLAVLAGVLSRYLRDDDDPQANPGGADGALRERAETANNAPAGSDGAPRAEAHLPPPDSALQALRPGVSDESGAPQRPESGLGAP